LKSFSKWQQAFAYLEREINVLNQLHEVLKKQAIALSGIDLDQLERCQLHLESLLAEAENNTFQRVKWQRSTFGMKSLPTWNALSEVVPQPMRSDFKLKVTKLTEIGAEIRKITEQNHRAAERADQLLSDLRDITHRSSHTQNQLYTSRGKLGSRALYQARIGGVP